MKSPGRHLGPSLAMLMIAVLAAASPLAAAAARLEVTHPDFGVAGQKAFASCATLPDGRIACAFALAPQRNWDSIYLATTSDAGRTWSRARKVMDRPGEGYIADPNVLAAPDGRVTVFATFVPRSGAGERKFAASQTLASTSVDGLETWSPPTSIPTPHKYVSGKVHVPAWLDERTVLMGYSWDIPAELSAPAGGEDAMYARAGVLVSTDAGRTWTPGGETFVNAYPIGADEPAIVGLGGRDVFMVMRTATQRPYESFSRDGGATWERPKPSVFFGHNSPSALLRLRDGSVLRVWDHSPRDRFPLVAAISRDGCRTWSAPRVITTPDVNAQGERSYDYACYPSAAQGRDGDVVVSWWERNGKRSRVGVATLAPQWLEPAGEETPMRAAADLPPAVVPPSSQWEIHEGIPFPAGRGSHAGGVVGGGRVVVAGGTSWNAERTVKSFLRDSLWFDRGIWTRGPDLPVPMAEGAFASDGKALYLVGGYRAPDVAIDAACRVTAADDGELRCEPVARLPRPMAGSAAAIVHGELVIAGGYVDSEPVNAVYSLDPAAPNGSWRKRTGFPGEARAYPALARCGEHLYLLGGLGKSREEGKLNPLRDAYRFDPRTDDWERMPDLPVSGYCWSAEPLDDERHLLLTGRADGQIHRDIWLLDVADGSAKRVGETVIQATCAPLVRGEPGALWLLGGEPDSQKNRTPRVTVIRPPAPRARAAGDAERPRP